MIDDSSGSTNRSARAGLLAPLGRLCARRPWLVIAAVALVTAVVSPFMARMRIETNLARLLPEDDPGRQATATVDREFGGSDIAVVIVEPGDVFQPQVLEALDSLAGAIAGIPGVTEVQSLTTLQDVSGQGDDVLIRAVVESIPHDAAAMRSLRESVLADKRYRGVLVSADGGSALLVARLAPVTDPAVTARELERVVQASSLGPVSSMAGSAVQMMYVQDWLMSDLVRLLPVVVLVLVLVLALMFRQRLRCPAAAFGRAARAGLDDGAGRRLRPAVDPADGVAAAGAGLGGQRLRHPHRRALEPRAQAGQKRARGGGHRGRQNGSARVHGNGHDRGRVRVQRVHAHRGNPRLRDILQRRGVAVVRAGRDLHPGGARAAAGARRRVESRRSIGRAQGAGPAQGSERAGEAGAVLSLQ